MFNEEVITNKSGVLVQVYKKPNISMKMKIYFMLTHLITSLDFGYTNFTSLQSRLCVKLMTLLEVIIVASICFYSYFFTNPPLIATWRSLYIGQYIIFVIILTSTTEISFCDFQRDLLSVDGKLGVVSSSYKIETKMIVMSAVFFILRVAIVTTHCTLFSLSCSISKFVVVFYTLPSCAGDSVLIVFFFLFYSVYCRLKKLTESLRDCSDVISAHYLYKSIIDSTEAIKNTFNPMFLTTLLYLVPSVLVTIYQTLLELHLILANPTSYCLIYFSFLLSLVLLFTPAAMADTLSNHADYMILVLQDKLLHERAISKKHVRDIKRLIRYIEARPFKFTVCRIIPLDLSLPVIILNLCITYLIVIIQFMY